MKKLIEFRVSLDGMKSHRILRNVNYNEVIKKIRLIRGFDFIVTVNTMITPYNKVISSYQKINSKILKRKSIF